jgi:hypothetical protein
MPYLYIYIILVKHPYRWWVIFSEMAAGKSPGRSTGSSYENGVDNWIVSIFFGGVCGYCYCEQHHETKNWLALQPARLSALSSLSVQAAKIGQNNGGRNCSNKRYPAMISKSWDSEHQKQQLVNGHSSPHNSKVVVGLDQSPKLFSLASADGLKKAPQLSQLGLRT